MPEEGSDGYELQESCEVQFASRQAVVRAGKVLLLH